MNDETNDILATGTLYPVLAIGYAAGRHIQRCYRVMIRLLTIPFLLVFVAGCTPTVQLEAPKEPIEINLNVKIEHNIRVQVDQELEDLFDEESDLF
jgi:hypothetical protein